MKCFTRDKQCPYETFEEKMSTASHSGPGVESGFIDQWRRRPDIVGVHFLSVLRNSLSALAARWPSTVCGRRVGLEEVHAAGLGTGQVVRAYSGHARVGNLSRRIG